MSPSKRVDITVRPAVEVDIAELSDTMAEDISPEQLANRWREYVAGYRVMLVALLDGDVAGTVSMGGHYHQRPDSLRLFALDVASALRRRGAGSALVCAVEHEAGLRGLGHLNLEVASRKRTSRTALR
jgi:ribosomal protein S18 acetylase RimI-like enzyme